MFRWFQVTRDVLAVVARIRFYKGAEEGVVLDFNNFLTGISGA